MIGTLILHPRTQEQATHYIAAPSHAILVAGPRGIGKAHLSQAMTVGALGIPADAFEQHPYIMRLQPEGTSISIEAIRELQRFLQLKTVGSSKQWRRAVIIEDADTLTTEAQNAYLKLLEEPPADTLMILTAGNTRALLPTILSRVQVITVHTPTEQAVKQHFATTADATALSQAYFLSGGLPGLMHALLDKTAEHPLLNGVTQAKAILQKQTSERLALVEALSKKKEEALYILEALSRIAQTGLAQATQKSDRAKLKQWHHILKATAAAQQSLLHNANPKLTLTHLMLHL